MKKVLAVLVLVLLSGSLFALTLTDSTFIGGMGFETISGGWDDVSSNVYGPSLYGCYDVKVGDRWYSRLEYDILVMPMTFRFKNIDYAKDCGLKRSASKRRVGGYMRIDFKNQVLNIGGTVISSKMSLTSEDGKTKLTNLVASIGLIIEWQYNLNEHFSFRADLSPELSLGIVDEINSKGDDGYSQTRTRAWLGLGFQAGARMGISYKF
ncbi:MAG: hypothetical protein IJ863_01715 [Spirochaetales bacterium]|nr:hypothetical protein [Spirochaetales bacterium]